MVGVAHGGGRAGAVAAAQQSRLTSAPPRGQEREFWEGEHRDGGKQAEGADA
jgi:hypothetical protein